MDPTFSLSSVLPATDSAAIAWTWVAETLADSNRADTSLLRGITSAFPDLVEKISAAARDRIALKYLEEWLDPGWRGPPPPCVGEGFDADTSAEDVLLKLLGKAATVGDLQKKETELFIRDLHQFILKKRAALPKCFIDQLADKGHVGFSPADFSKEKSVLSGVDLADLNGFECHSQQNGDCQNDHSGDMQNGDKGTLVFSVDQLLLLKRISAAHSPDADKAILQEYTSGSGQRSEQPNGDKIQLLNQISAAPSPGNGQEMLQEDPCIYGQQSDQQMKKKNDMKFKSVKHVSTALAVENVNRVIQHDTYGLGCQASQLKVSEGDNGSFAHAETSSTCGEIMLQEGPCGFGKQSLLQIAQHNDKKLQSVKEILDSDNYKQILERGASGSRKPSPEQNSAPLSPCEKRKKYQDAEELGSKLIIHPSIYRGEVSRIELSIPKTAGDVDGCCSLSCENQQKKMLGDEMHQSSDIPVVQHSTEGDMIENGLCFRCDQGGLLLNCSSNNCSVSVHANCIGSNITFDEKDCFICPSCSYTQAALSYFRAKKRYSQAKKAFESFVGKGSKLQSQQELSHPGGLWKNDKTVQGVNLTRHHRSGRQKKNIANVGVTGKGCQSIGVERQISEAIETPGDDNFAFEKTDVGVQEQISKAKTTPEIGNLACQKSDINGCQSILLIKQETLAEPTAYVMAKGGECIVAGQQIPESNGTLDNGNVACKEADASIIEVTSDVHQVTLHTGEETGLISGCPCSVLMKQENLAEHPELPDNVMGKGCENIAAEQPIALCNTTTENGDLASHSSRTEVTCNVLKANLKETTALVEPYLHTQTKKDQKQPKFVIEQFAYSPSEETATRLLTNETYAKKRKLDVQTDVINDAGHHLAVDKATTENDISAGEEGEASRIREMSAVCQDYRTSKNILLDSDMEKKKPEGQSNYVVDTPQFSRQESLTLLTGVVAKNREHADTPPIHCDHLTSKDTNGQKLSLSDEWKCEGNSNNGSKNKKTKHYWTTEEEKALREAMRNVSLDDKGNVPWTKIWGMISHIFREARHPSDLRVKWRNIRSKEARNKKKLRF